MKRFLICIIIVLCSVRATAQSDSSTLDEVIITANKFPQKQQQTGKVLTVITRQVLEKSTGRNMGEILNQYAGFTIIGANNNPGTNLDVYTRGSGLGNTLILIDGMPIYDVSSISSAFDLNFISPDMVERIEILKGGQSTVYGSDAVAGVINIITKKAFKKALQVNANAAGGSFGTYKLGAGVNGTSGDLKYSLQYQYISAEGMSSALDTTGKAGFDKDGLKQHNVLASLSGKFSDKLNWKLLGQFTDYKTDLDADAYTDEKDHTVANKNYIAGGGLEYHLSKSVIHANYNLNFTNRDYLDDSLSVGGFSKFSTSTFKGLSHVAEVYANITASEKLSFIAGTDLRSQKTDQYYLSISDFGPFESKLSEDSANIKVYSAYASAFLNSGNGFFMEAGGRWNNHSMYGNNFTYSLNPSFVKGRWKIFVNIASAFKAPTLYQLYDAKSGEPGLNPEKSTSFESGLQYSALEKAWQSRVVLFTRKLKDGIDFSLIDFKYFNNNNATDKGIELESQLKKGKWQMTFNYTYVTGEVNTIKYKYDPPSFSYLPDGDTTYNYQFRRPSHSANLQLGYQFNEKLFTSVHGRYSGNRFEPRYMQAPLEVDAYFVLDLYGEYRFNSKFRIFADLKNVLDNDYVDIPGFTTRPFNFMAGISVSF